MPRLRAGIPDRTWPRAITTTTRGLRIYRVFADGDLWVVEVITGGESINNPTHRRAK